MQVVAPDTTWTSCTAFPTHPTLLKGSPNVVERDEQHAQFDPSIHVDNAVSRLLGSSRVGGMSRLISGHLAAHPSTGIAVGRKQDDLHRRCERDEVRNLAR
jgi:hypothetical protein